MLGVLPQQQGADIFQHLSLRCQSVVLCRAGPMADDPLLASIVHKLGPAPAQSMPSMARPSRGKSPLDLSLWVIPFQQLQLVRSIGQGAFGRVSPCCCWASTTFLDAPTVIYAASPTA